MMSAGNMAMGPAGVHTQVLSFDFKSCRIVMDVMLCGHNNNITDTLIFTLKCYGFICIPILLILSDTLYMYNIIQVYRLCLARLLGCLP